MGGLAGVLRPANDLFPVEQVRGRMLGALTARGGAGVAVYAEPEVLLCRTGVRTGSHPRDGAVGEGIAVVLDGEIYNRPALWARIRCARPGACDAELLACLYREFGIEMVRELNGV